jgi:hypothetical protein
MSRSPCSLYNDRKVTCRIARIRVAGALDRRLTSPMQKTRRKPRPLPHSDWRTKYGILLGVSTTAPCGVLLRARSGDRRYRGSSGYAAGATASRSATIPRST